MGQVRPPPVPQGTPRPSPAPRLGCATPQGNGSHLATVHRHPALPLATAGPAPAGSTRSPPRSRSGPRPPAVRMPQNPETQHAVKARAILAGSGGAVIGKERGFLGRGGGLTLTLTEPSIFHSSPSRADSKEDFPAPTGPTTASRQPCGTVRSTLWAKRGHESWSGPSPFLCSEPHAPQPSPGVDLEGRRQLRAAEASPSCAQSSGNNSGCHPAHICAHTLSLTPVHAYHIYERRQELLHIRPHTGAHHAHGPVGRHTADGGVKPSPASPPPWLLG